MKVRSVFLDTSGWRNLLDDRESAHSQANDILSYLGRLQTAIVFTDWVVAETGNGLARSALRARFVESLRRYQQLPQTRLVMIDNDLLERAVTLYDSRKDKGWGLVDCASFIVMGDLGIS